MVPAYVTASLAGAGLIVGSIFGVMALDSQSQFKGSPTDALADQTERNALICDMSLGIAVTLGITSVVLFTSKGGGSTTAKTKPARQVGRLTLLPYASPTSGGARAHLTF
jgi:hypothetical protein